MWIYVLVGNILRGIGETPVQPLGISYIDDYAQSDNAALYIGNPPSLQLIALIGIFFIRNFLEGYFETRKLGTTKDELTFYRLYIYRNIFVSLCFHVREILDMKKKTQSAVNRPKKNQFCNVV